MNIIIFIFLGLVFTVGGAALGARRISVLIAVFFAAFLSFSFNKSFGEKFINTVVIIGFKSFNALFINLFIILALFFISIYIFIKVINRLGIFEYSDEYDSGSGIINRIAGSGLGLLIYLLGFSILGRIFYE